MSSKNSTTNYGGFGGIVNGLAVLVTISAGWRRLFSALGLFRRGGVMSKLLHLMAAGMLAAFAMVSFIGLATGARLIQQV